MQNCCRQHECYCPPVPPWKITQNNPAEQLGQHETNEFKWFSFSDENHLHDRAQILKEGLLPRHPWSTPTSCFVDKFVFAFFPTAATKIRNLPPVHAKDLGQSVFETANPVSPTMPPCLVTRANSGTFHDLPPSLRFATRLPHVRGGSYLSEPHDPPIHTQPPTLCATRTEGSICILTPAQSVLSYETNPPTERHGIFALPACSGATWFPGLRRAAEFCRRNPATRTPQNT